MSSSIKLYFKHLGLTLLALLITGAAVLWYIGATIHYSDHPQLMDVHGEGPYVFYKGDSALQINYINRNKIEGFEVEQYTLRQDSQINISCTYLKDSSSFQFELSSETGVPKSSYTTDQDILVISDIEGSYEALRDFLLAHKVVDASLGWTFGQKHLVLLGDFVDRGGSVIQTLWLIYKLEQEAKKSGGQVHFIIGNHELYNLQGNYKSASPKYLGIASILSRQPHELYSKHSVLGRWLSAKNTIEKINGHLFVHGGIHPEITNYTADLDSLNILARAHYYTSSYPKPIADLEQLINSRKTGLAWYRGYFNNNVTQSDIENILTHLKARDIIVGHTLQSKVNKSWNDKVIAIDVAHPKDYQNYWPKRRSEGLMINSDNQYYKLLDNGDKIEI